jgi:ribosomal protein S18 acetylase RimI-like enzyme
VGAAIRKARPDDAAALAAVRVAASVGDAPHSDPALFAELIGSRTGLVYVAERGGAVVGYVAVQPAAHPAVAGEHPLQLWHLYVDPAFHGSGVAAQLMSRAVRHAQSHRHDVIWLGVSEHNSRGQAFYRKQGFTALGLHEIGATPHTHLDVLMSCTIR